MNIFDLPRQLQHGPGMNLGPMEEYADSELSDLLGECHAHVVMESVFQHEVNVGMDVAVLTHPWVG